MIIFWQGDGTTLVTDANKTEFAQKLVHCRLVDSIQDQLSALANGLQTIVRWISFSLFSSFLFRSTPFLPPFF